MKTITIRDLRLHWPKAEAALKLENELLITRDSVPVAKLVRIAEPKSRRKRWNPDEHRKWIKKVFGNKVFESSEAELFAARADRKLM
jgi:antitoxin (DNA-binding transcriptional repressor) of toxin-antitoxin stability system